MATEQRLFLSILSCVIPAALLLASLSIEGPFSTAGKIVACVIFLAWIVAVAHRARHEFLHHVRTLSNLVEATRREDYGIKSSRASERGELGELYGQINSLAESLKNSRQSERELMTVLEKVVSQINVAIVVFDARDRIRLANVLAAALLRSSAEKLAGVSRVDTVLAQLPVAEEPRLVDFRFPGGEGRWQVRQHFYRHRGEVSRILFIADLKQVLSDQEIAAWQRLIRVISHEVNNSLTPITSLCQTLSGLLAKPDGLQNADVREGLSVIAERARGLQDFISVYARIARLPEPHKVIFAVAELAGKLQRIFAGHALQIAPFPEIAVFGDPIHLEQALINLIKNGLEANPPGGPAVQLSCHIEDGRCEFRIADHGAGISNPANLFVPFYTTKAEGTGVGLILCRQIAARHHGEVSLENRSDGPGAVARFILPLPPRE